MKLVSYDFYGTPRLGVLHDEWIVDGNRAYLSYLRETGDESRLPFSDALVPSSVLELLRGGQQSMDALASAVGYIAGCLADDLPALYQRGIIVGDKDTWLHPPVIAPSKVLGVAWNYPKHVADAGMQLPEFPVIFPKMSGCLLGHEAAIQIPRMSYQINFEAELVLVIGRRAKHVARGEALDFVAGYSCGNDVSAMDLEQRSTQIMTGVMFDTFGPVGPALVTRDEVPDPGNLKILSRLNDEEFQNGNTRDMIYDVRSLVSYFSDLTTLEPGDIIFTGAPEGIAPFRDPPRFLNAGDVVSIEIEGVGTLTNSVKDEVI